MDSKFNSWSNNDPTDSFTSVLIDASMKVPPLTFSFHSPCSDFPVCPVLDTLTPWYECWQKSLIENARVPPCSRFSGGSSHRNFDGRNSYNYRACGALRGEYSAGRFKGEIFCMYHCPLVHVPTFPRFLCVSLFIVSKGASVTPVSGRVSSLFAEFFFHFC